MMGGAKVVTAIDRCYRLSLILQLKKTQTQGLFIIRQRNDEDRVLMEYWDNKTVSCSMKIFQKQCNEVTPQPLLVNDRDIKSDIFNGLREKP